MNRHDELRKKLDELNFMFRSEAVLFITEILKYIMDTIQPERTSGKDHVGEDTAMICDVPNTPTKGSESTGNE